MFLEDVREGVKGKVARFWGDAAHFKRLDGMGWDRTGFLRWGFADGV